MPLPKRTLKWNSAHASELINRRVIIAYKSVIYYKLPPPLAGPSHFFTRSTFEETGSLKLFHSMPAAPRAVRQLTMSTS